MVVCGVVRLKPENPHLKIAKPKSQDPHGAVYTFIESANADAVWFLSESASIRTMITPTLNDETDFRVSFDDFEDEDYTGRFVLSRFVRLHQFPFNIILPDDLKSKNDNDDNDIDIIDNLQRLIYSVNEIMAMAPYHQCKPEDKYLFLRYHGLEYTDANIADFKERLERIYSQEIHQVQVIDAATASPTPPRERVSNNKNIGVDEGTLRFREVLLDLDAPDTIQFQLGRDRRRLSWRQFVLALGLHTGEEMESLGFARYWSESERMIPEKGGLHDYWRGISTDGDFLRPPISYTLIRDPMLRLCHRMMARSIVGRSQAPEKVTVTDLFYLRGLDVGSVNIPYLLGRYLRSYFPELSTTDVAELVRLQIYEQLDDTWVWVAMGSERQPDDAASAPAVAQEAPVIDEDGQADPAPVQAPPPPPAAARTMPQRMARLEEDVHEIRGTLVEHREVISAMARDFSRFCTWTTTSLARMMDREGVTYTSYSETPREYT
ncbi:hypothetical protein Tco_1200120, partial [Tanacetum coccineum]